MNINYILDFIPAIKKFNNKVRFWHAKTEEILKICQIDPQVHHDIWLVGRSLAIINPNSILDVCELLMRCYVKGFVSYYDRIILNLRPDNKRNEFINEFMSRLVSDCSPNGWLYQEPYYSDYIKKILPHKN